ncbi:MAG TPA: DUF2927 domain-containing protein [Candidatus Cybelea sp.]|nr:DUF2927 domain-containing protein [Candidatus Cybelea sp.]
MRLSGVESVMRYCNRDLLGQILLAIALLAASMKLTASPSFAQDPLLTPDLQQRVDTLSQEDQRELAPVAARIATLFAPAADTPSTDLNSRLHRWETQVKVWAPIDQEANPSERDALDAEISKLEGFVKQHDGPRVELVSSPDDANFWILWGPLSGLLQEGTTAKIASKFFGGHKAAAASFDADLSSNACVHHLNIFGPQNSAPVGSIAQAVTMIRSDVSLQDQTACMRRGFAAAMGFVNDTTFFPGASWTQRAAAMIVPTAVDGELLRLLYSSMLKPDMDARTATHIMLDAEIAVFEHKEGKD